MANHTQELRKYIVEWLPMVGHDRHLAVMEIVKLLADEQGFKAPTVTIITLGPPHLRGVYDQPSDTLYVNRYLLDFDDFKPVLRSLVHLVRYKGQVADVLKYLELEKADPSVSTNPQYENIRNLKSNTEWYTYPWGDAKPVDDQSKELFWISTNKHVDWDDLKKNF